MMMMNFSMLGNKKLRQTPNMIRGSLGATLKCLLNCTPSIEFSISTNAPLEVDPVSGVVYAPVEGAFDYETNPEHTVRIVATDSRDNPELSRVSPPFIVTISVEDVNDEPPRLTSPDGTQGCNSIDSFHPRICSRTCPKCC